MATILRVSEQQRLEPYHEPSNVSIKALLGNRHDLDGEIFECFWQDNDTMFSMYQQPRRLKSLKGVRGVNEPGYLKQHPPARYTFVGLSPVQGNYSAKSLIRIPEPGFDRCSKGLSCGEALLMKPPSHWESSRAGKPMFIPVRSSTCQSPLKMPFKNNKFDSAYSSYGNTCTSYTTTGMTRSCYTGFKSVGNTPRSKFKIPRVTPVTTVTPVSITLDVSIMRKDSMGDQNIG
ncbi:uncharacterized protein [Ptychodera flava]|uniref:uncharacterized protein n=1 Tax=Ptychodera flava TaxID=63121 RepID=UPI00396A6655